MIIIYDAFYTFFQSSTEKLYHRHVAYTETDDLSELMNGRIRKHLGIIPNNVTWGGEFWDCIIGRLAFVIRHYNCVYDLNLQYCYVILFWTLTINIIQ